MFAGKKITIGDKEYVVPALTLGQLRNQGIELIKQHDALVSGGDGFGSYELRGKIILLALNRNYPDMTEAQLFDLLDMDNVKDAWQAVLGVSGLTASGEDQAAKAVGT